MHRLTSSDWQGGGKTRGCRGEGAQLAVERAPDQRTPEFVLLPVPWNCLLLALMAPAAGATAFLLSASFVLPLSRFAVCLLARSLNRPPVLFVRSFVRSSTQFARSLLCCEPGAGSCRCRLPIKLYLANFSFPLPILVRWLVGRSPKTRPFLPLSLAIVSAAPLRHSLSLSLSLSGFSRLCVWFGGVCISGQRWNQDAHLTLHNCSRQGGRVAG